MATRFLADPHCFNCSGRGYTLVNSAVGGIRLSAVQCSCRVLLPELAADRATFGRVEANAAGFPGRCNRCKRPMRGTTAYDGACACGGLIEAWPDA